VKLGILTDELIKSFDIGDDRHIAASLALVGGELVYDLPGEVVKLENCLYKSNALGKVPIGIYNSEQNSVSPGLVVAAIRELSVFEPSRFGFYRLAGLDLSVTDKLRVLAEYGTGVGEFISCLDTVVPKTTDIFRQDAV